MKPEKGTGPGVPFSALVLWREAGRQIRLETRGFSMRPLIEPGDEITIQLMEPDALRIGDLMAFWNGNTIVVHRLVKKRRSENGRWYCEKADALPGWNWVDEEFVLGRVVCLQGSKGRLRAGGWPWTWINPAVGLTLSVCVTLVEKVHASRPRMPEKRSGLLKSIEGFLLEVCTWIYQAVLTLLLCAVRFCRIR